MGVQPVAGKYKKNHFGGIVAKKWQQYRHNPDGSSLPNLTFANGFESGWK
jgi:hypothetical protein